MLDEKNLRKITVGGEKLRVTPIFSTWDAAEPVSQLIDDRDCAVVHMDEISLRVVDEHFRHEGVACLVCGKPMLYRNARRPFASPDYIECPRCETIIDISADRLYWFR